MKNETIKQKKPKARGCRSYPVEAILTRFPGLDVAMYKVVVVYERWGGGRTTVTKRFDNVHNARSWQRNAIRSYNSEGGRR